MVYFYGWLYQIEITLYIFDFSFINLLFDYIKIEIYKLVFINFVDKY